MDFTNCYKFMNYSCSNDCALFRQYYFDYNPSKLKNFNKRIVPGKSFMVITAVIFAVGMTK